ncbi:enoyl-CoA hydratase/isomerase family protein [Cognatiyoonia sp.]|uniref:enoyl-CoA hydratase/isomerase family protein n=1 Tax=Cognatiyoonia sp. TaxID=2211652 RepID=UPI003F697DE9
MITTTKEGALTILTLNRPDKANALTPEMIEALIEAVQDNADQKVLVLTGAGKVFCAGADLDAAKAGLATSPLWEELSGVIAEFKGLTIAALNGTLAGGAFGMALACDLRISVETAKFFYPVIKLGYRPQPSDPKRLRDLVGPAGAKRIFLLGEKMSAVEAHRIGLVDCLVTEGDVVLAAQELAAMTLDAEVEHVQAIKTMI